MIPLCSISPKPLHGTAVLSRKQPAYNKNKRQKEGMPRSRGSAPSRINPFSWQGREPAT